MGYLRRVLDVTLRDIKHRSEMRHARDVRTHFQSAHNELIFKVLCCATISVSQKLLFAQLKNTSKHSTAG